MPTIKSSGFVAGFRNLLANFLLKTKTADAFDCVALIVETKYLN